jgi:hypothetical protein
MQTGDEMADVTWQDELAREMGEAERRASQRSADIAKAMAAREVKIAELWRLVDRVIEGANARVPEGGRRFHSEETDSPRSKAIFYGGRRLLLEVEALAYDRWRNEPAFYPSGLARVYVDPPARDATAFFCAVSAEGARWVVMPTRRQVGEATIAALLRALLS